MYCVRVEVVTTVDSAGQLVTVEAHEVMVISVVLITVDVVCVVMMEGADVVEGEAWAELVGEETWAELMVDEA